MTDHEQELISAYLDGELSPDDRARVDARLASDGAARQLLAELRALRGELRSLPRDAVSHDFAAAVVRRAVSAAGGGALARPAADDGDNDRAPWRRLIRPLAYAGFATAAALLVALFSQRGGDRDLALKTQSAPPAETAPLAAPEQTAPATDALTTRGRARDNQAPAPPAFAPRPAAGQIDAGRYAPMQFDSTAAAPAPVAANDEIQPADILLVECVVPADFDRRELLGVLAKNSLDADSPEKETSDHIAITGTREQVDAVIGWLKDQAPRIVANVAVASPEQLADLRAKPDERQFAAAEKGFARKRRRVAETQEAASPAAAAEAKTEQPRVTAVIVLKPKPEPPE